MNENCGAAQRQNRLPAPSRPKGRSALRKPLATAWRRGQSAVELALAAPLLALLLVVVGDGGRMFFTYLEVVGAARAGAQYGAQTLVTATDNSGMQTHALSAAPNLSGLTATATNYCCCQSGSTCANFGTSNTTSTTDTTSCGVKPSCSDWRKYVQVNTTATFTTLVKYPGLPSSLTFKAESILRAR